MGRKKVESRIQSTRTRKEQILSRCEGVCTHCGKEIRIGDDFTVEHVIPLSKGGTNDFNNLVALCEDCNKEKDNDIVDAEYYSPAPKVVYEEIERRLNEYFEEHDWLTQTNVFRVDRFEVPVTQTIPLKNGKIMSKRTTCVIRKIKDEEESKFIEAFNAVNFPSGVVDNEEPEDGDPEASKMSDFYQVKYKDKPVMLFSLGLFARQEATLWIRVFVNPDILWGPSSRIILSECIDGVIRQFVESLKARGTKSAVMCFAEAYLADRKGKELVESLGNNFWRNGCQIGESKVDEVFNTIFAPTIIGDGLEALSEEQEDETGVIGKVVSSEAFKKHEKLYRSQLKRRMKQNG